MKSKNKKIIIFIIGCISGFIFELLASLASSANHFLFQIVSFPTKLGGFVGNIILWPMCKLEITSTCATRDMGDIGLNTTEQIWLFGGTLIGYGIIFIFVYLLYLKAKNKITGGNSK